MNNKQRYTTKELETYIRSEYAKLAPIAKQDGVYRPLDDYFGTETPSRQDGSFCFSDENGYHYGTYERGILIENIVTQSIFEITFQVLSSDVFMMVDEYECRHRQEGEDSRRLLFQKELQYWKVLGLEYAEQAKCEIDECLAEAPFVD